MVAEATDEALMLRYRDGDGACFDELYRRHRGPLYRYLRRQCQGVDPVAVEELFQDIWLKLIQARRRYRPSAKFTTYLYRMAHNRVIDHYRAVSRHPPTVPIAEPECDDAGTGAFGGAAEPPDDAVHMQPDRLLQRRRDAERLLAQLAALPAEQREAFLLQQEAGLSLQAIADITEVSRETVKSRLRYAVQKLRKGLDAAPLERESGHGRNTAR